MTTLLSSAEPELKVKGKTFTRDYPDCNYQPTLNSNHPQSKFWPAYLPVDPLRLVIFERSKNAQLVVYSANRLETGSNAPVIQLNPRDPIDIQWLSFGWTDSSTTNAPGRIERKIAWGYSAKPMSESISVEAGEAQKVKDSSSSSESPPPAPATGVSQTFEIQLVALANRRAILTTHAGSRVEMDINATRAHLHKVFVSTKESFAGLLPRVEYVEFYGTCLTTGQDCIEKYIPS